MSFRLLVERLAAYWQQQVVVAGVDLDVLLELAPRTNLFTSLSIPILGVPALMAGITPEKTPMPVKTWELESGWLWMVLFVGLSLVGLSLSAVYLELTAYVIRKQRDESTPLNVYAFLRQTGLVWLKLLGMAITFIVSAFLIYLPLMIVGMIMALFNEALASIVLLMGPMLLLWLLIYFSFTPFGIVLNGRPLWRAMIESLQLVRRYVWSVLSMLLLVLLISQGLDWVLLMADDGSWLTWVSIWGHAFVSTALLAAIFIFYRDRHTALYGVRNNQPSNI